MQAEEKTVVKSEVCVNRKRRLLSGEAAALGLDPRRKWYACTTGEHKAHCGCKDKAKAV